jgi:hypothetical protein
MEGITYKQFFERLYTNTYYRHKMYREDVFVTLIFTKDNVDTTLTENEDYRWIKNHLSKAEIQKPERIIAEVRAGSYHKTYRGEFHVVSNQIPQNTSPFQSVSNQFPMETQQNPIGFQGFGQVSVDEYINRKLNDDRVEREITELKKEVVTKDQEILALKQTIEKLEGGLEESLTTQEKLNNDLEAKKTIRYWASLAGDIMESIGIKKETLREPLAGLIAKDNVEQAQVIQHTDDSGIVEEDNHQGKRNELIELISEFLKNQDDQMLANIFLIFSEIEASPEKAKQIIEFIHKQKQQ